MHLYCIKGTPLWQLGASLIKSFFCSSWQTESAESFLNSVVMACHLPAVSVRGLEWASAKQWCSQDIADARAQHGHTTFVRTSARSAEAFRGVHPQKSFGISQPPRSGSEAIWKSLTANSHTVSVRGS